MNESNPADSARSNPAVVIGLHTMQGLQTARLLHQRGVEVIGVTADDRHPFNRTRHCVEVVHTKSAPGDLTATLVQIGSRLDSPAVLVPCQDWAVLEISERRAELDPLFLYRLPSHDVVELLSDKASFHAHALGVDLPVPESRVLRDRADAEAAADEMIFPCVLKPSSRSNEWSTNTDEKAFEVADRSALLEVYDRVGGWVDSLVVQQWIVGPEDNLFSVNGYFDRNGTALATFVARKIRQWPVRTGQSSLGVECRNDEVLDLFGRLFKSVDYCGLAYLEVKQDSRTHKHYLVEPNIGRPTGRSPIAEAGGVELLDTMYCDIVGLALPDEVQRQQTFGSAKWIHLRRDLMASLTMMRNKELSPRDWAKSMRGPKFFAVWDRTDPAPFMGDLARTGELAVRSRLPNRRTNR